MRKICLVFCKSEPQYAYKRYAHKKTYSLNYVCVWLPWNAFDLFHKTVCIFRVLMDLSTYLMS